MNLTVNVMEEINKEGILKMKEHLHSLPQEAKSRHEEQN